jgi:hypothetical protein
MKTLTTSFTTVLFTSSLLSIGLIGLLAPPASGQPQGKTEERGVALFNGKNLDGWKLRDEKLTDTWKVVSQVALDPNDAKKLVGTGAGGTADAVLFRQPVAHGSDLLTEKAFGDCELHIEVMVP